MTIISTLHFWHEIDVDYPFFVQRLEDAPDHALSTNLRRHTYYLAIWVTSGSGQHVVDFEKNEIRPNSLFFVRPGQVQQWLIDEPVTGLVCLFNEAIFHVHGAHQFFNELSFLAPFVKTPSYFVGNAEQARQIQVFFDNIYASYESSGWGQGAEILSWLQLLCIFAERESEQVQPIQTLTPSQQITRDFLNLADKNAMEEHNLAFYAGKLGITVGHLTETVKAVYGISAGELLRNRLILEAKRLLAHTDLTMAEIAEQLNYTDPSYFGRAFKRDAGQTPRNFRQEFRRA